MAFSLIPTNTDIPELEYPNGFWVACMVDTPVSTLLGTYHTERRTIWYDHTGYVGESAFTEEEAHRMHTILTEYIKTDEYAAHPYFNSRRNQMEQFPSFLPECRGFIKG